MTHVLGLKHITPSMYEPLLLMTGKSSRCGAPAVGPWGRQLTARAHRSVQAADRRGQQEWRVHPDQAIGRAVHGIHVRRTASLEETHWEEGREALKRGKPCEAYILWGNRKTSFVKDVE